MKITIQTKSKEEQMYDEYLREHIANVKKAYDLYSGILLDYLTMKDKTQLLKRVNRHDLSKWSKEEYQPYIQYFYPKEGQTPNEEIFERAWQHHYKNNDHHPEYWWREGRESLAMTNEAIAEMFLDWIAMTMKFKTNMVEWFKEHKDELNFNPYTLVKVEEILNLEFINEI